MNKEFCAFKRTIKYPIELDRPYFTSFFLVLNFKLAACELCKGLGHKISLKTELQKKENMNASIKISLFYCSDTTKTIRVISYLPISTY